MYSIHYRIIKYVGFKMIYYALNLDVASFSRVFSKFDCVSMIVLLI